MAEELQIYEPSRALYQTNGKNYLINSPTGQMTLKRDVDFGCAPNASGRKAFKQPILLKPGAEKIAFGFGLCQRYTTTTEKLEVDAKGNVLLYLVVVRCDLVKFVPDVGEIVISNSYGSANTSEKRNGSNMPADALNATLKMAQKRALVGAALAISGLSDLFTQDIENETFMDAATDIIKETPERPITPKQIQRIFAIASNAGLNTVQAKERLKILGYDSTKSILQKDYDRVCEEMGKGV